MQVAQILTIIYQTLIMNKGATGELSVVGEKWSRYEREDKTKDERWDKTELELEKEKEEHIIYQMRSEQPSMII